jgi:hypothetical protein
MRTKKEDLPVALEAGAAFSRQTDWGEMTVAYDGVPAGFDSTSIDKGFPGDRCPCPHWGYVLKGRVRVRYADRDEIFSAGDVYYMEPGHTMLVEEDYEAVEFSPRDEWNKTKEVIMRNLAATQ